MSSFDLSLDELEMYQPPRVEEKDFDVFWHRTLTEARAYPLDARFQMEDSPFHAIDVLDLTFNGYRGQPIKGWLMLPRRHPQPLPCVIEYVGYGGGRGFPHEHLLWPSLGYANLVMDTRGQGSWGSIGETPDPEADLTNQYPGFMTRGILDPNTYYYRRVFTDAVRAVEAVLGHPAVDRERLAVTGASQGGGIALAVAALEPTVTACMPDVPFLCHYRRATALVDTRPYLEIVNYCKAHRDKVDTVFRTLSYFDGVNFAARARARSLFSVGLRDDVCPPSTVFAAYYHYAGKKQMKVYEFNQHDGGGAHHDIVKSKFLSAIWPRPRSGDLYHDPEAASPGHV